MDYLPETNDKVILKTRDITKSFDTKVYEIVTIHSIKFAVVSEPGNPLYLAPFVAMTRIGNRVWATYVDDTVGASRRA